MNITENQYSTVINGLRTQLELQREKTREVQARLDGTLTSFNKLVSEGLTSKLEHHRESNEHQDRRARLQSRLTAIGQAATDPTPPSLNILDDNWSPEFDVVVRLRAERDALQAQVDAPKAKKRARK
jgi:hypothetical protein